MTADQQQELEELGNKIESIARSMPGWKHKTPDVEGDYYEARDLIEIAWNLKQLIRKPKEIQLELITLQSAI